MNKNYHNFKCGLRTICKEWKYNFHHCKNNPKTKSSNSRHYWHKNPTNFNSAKTQKTNSRKPTSKSPITFQLKFPNSKEPTTKVKIKYFHLSSNRPDSVSCLIRWVPIKLYSKDSWQISNRKLLPIRNLLIKKLGSSKKILTNSLPNKKRPSKNSINPPSTTKNYLNNLTP